MPPSLNPQQAAAVAHRDGPLLVLAGAGTGKTRVVTERIARLMDGGVAPANILAVTFTNKAAGEMRARLARLAGKRHDLSALVMATFHSLAVRLLRRDPAVLGYRPGFTICDQGEQFSLVRKAARTVKGSAAHDPKDLLERIGAWKNAGVPPDAARRDAFEEADLVAAGVYRRYQEALRRLNAFDFDDLLVQSLALLSKSPEALAHWRDRFHYLLVDEFQDTNGVQYELVQRLAAPRDNLCVVGDDDQSIYAWRGALAGHLLDFPKRHPGARVVALEQNYRSVNGILRAANAVIARNEHRHPKTLRSALGEGEPIRLWEVPDQFDEALRIVDDLRARLAAGAKPGDFAIILRANAQGRPIEEELLGARLPFEVIGGQRFFDREEARDALAYLTAVANPAADAALLRIANTPPRGLGEKSLDALAAHAQATGRPLEAALAAPEAANVAGKPAEAARALARQLADWREHVRREGVDHIVSTILKGVRYEQELYEIHDDPMKAADRYQVALDVGESVRRFARRRAERGEPAADGLALLAEFAQEAALFGDDDRRADDAPPDAVRLITGHSAKGLEFLHVYIPGVEEGLWPHKNTEEESATGAAEERRLFYVALTRARRTLTLSHCLARTSRGKGQPRAPSRFLADIPAESLRKESAYLSGDELDDWLAKMGARGKNGAAADADRDVPGEGV